MDSNEDWSLRAEQGILVIKDETILERNIIENFHEVLDRLECT